MGWQPLALAAHHQLLLLLLARELEGQLTIVTDPCQMRQLAMASVMTLGIAPETTSS